MLASLSTKPAGEVCTDDLNIACVRRAFVAAHYFDGDDGDAVLIRAFEHADEAGIEHEPILFFCVVLRGE